jgi:hypothetical protein
MRNISSFPKNKINKTINYTKLFILIFIDY